MGKHVVFSTVSGATPRTHKHDGGGSDNIDIGGVRSGVSALCTRSVNFRGRSEMDLFIANIMDLCNESLLRTCYFA